MRLSQLAGPACEMEIMLSKTRYSSEGCRITTVVRKHPSYGTQEEVILQAEDLNEPKTPFELVEEDTGQWLIGGS